MQHDGYSYKYDSSSSSISMLFQRPQSTRFSTSPPDHIYSNTYYQGSTATPLIDGFIIEEGAIRRSPILCLIQITVSQGKKNTTQSGPKLVDAIILQVERRLRCTIHVRFLLIEPGFGSDRLESPTTSWTFQPVPLAAKRHMEVYVGTLDLPNAL